MVKGESGFLDDEQKSGQSGFVPNGQQKAADPDPSSALGLLRLLQQVLQGYELRCVSKAFDSRFNVILEFRHRMEKWEHL